MTNAYLVITEAGNWGKGNTLLEACENACVGRDKVNAYVVIYNKDYVQANCTGAGGYTSKFTNDVVCGFVDTVDADWKKTLRQHLINTMVMEIVCGLQKKGEHVIITDERD